MRMYKVTITLNNEHRISNTVTYFWADDVCDQLNRARRDAFVPVAGMLVQPEDISSIVVEEIKEGVRFNDMACGRGNVTGGGCSDSDLDNNGE